METLVLNGKTYVKASKAARDLGYTSDYVGQLCRGKHIDAHLVGRTWYVDPEELGTHRVEKKRMSRIKAREQAHKSIEEHRKLHSSNAENSYRNVAIRYDQDDSALAPQPRKLSVESEMPKEAIEQHRPVETTKSYEIENRGKKVHFSGKITVIDADEDHVDDATVLLSPKIMKHHAQPGPESHTDFFRKELAHLEETAVEEPVEPEPEEEAEEELYETTPLRSDDTSNFTTVPLAPQAKSKNSYWGIVVMLALLVVVTFMSVTLETVWNYYSLNSGNSSYSFNTNYNSNLAALKNLK